MVKLRPLPPSLLIKRKRPVQDGKQWAHWNHPYFNQAQALLELAVFGSILIMLLGVLINYGLRYNYQQRLMQYAFREALASAHPLNAGAPGTPSSVQHIVIQDSHIPDPSNPFAIGAVIPVSGSASVNRSYLSNIPENYNELPEMQIKINGVLRKYKTAGIRRVCADEPQQEKYAFIYGAGNLDDELISPLPCASGQPMNIIDTSGGEIIDYNSALRRCRMIMDKQVCIEQCEESPAEINCQNVCNQDIEIPWYCEKLNQLFYPPAATGRKDMGMQPDYTAETTQENVLRKEEDAQQITTTDTLDWTETRTRKITHRNYTAASDDRSGALESDEVKTSVGQQRPPASRETAH